MKDVILLTKILLKSSTKQSGKKTSIKSKIIGYLFLYVYIAGIIAYMSFNAVESLLEFGYPEMFLNVVFLFTLGFIITRSIFTHINFLFFSQDIEDLLPLPIKPYKIVMAKFNCLVISEYILCATITMPALIVYGILLKASFIYYLIMIFGILLFPIVPVLLMCILLTVIMRFTNIIRNKNVVQYITALISVIIIVFLAMVSNSNEYITDDEFVQGIIKIDNITQNISNYMPTLKSVVNTLNNYNNIIGFKNFIILITESILFYVIIAFVASKFYLKTVTNRVSVKRRKGLLKKKEIKAQRVCRSYVKKEIKNILRNPIFFMQCAMPSFVFPILIGSSIYYSIFKDELLKIEEIKNVVYATMNTPLGFSFFIALLMFFFAFNYVAVTAISREGSNSVFMKYIPISLEKQCFYKILPGIILNFIPLIYLIIILKLLLPQISNTLLMYIILISALGNVKKNYSMIIKDLKNPKLQWTSEYTVVKQNLNLVYQLVSVFNEIIVIILLGALIPNLKVYVLVMSLLYLFTIYRKINYIEKNEKELLKNIEI